MYPLNRFNTLDFDYDLLNFQAFMHIWLSPISLRIFGRNMHNHGRTKSEALKLYGSAPLASKISRGLRILAPKPHNGTASYTGWIYSFQTEWLVIQQKW